MFGLVNFQVVGPCLSSACGALSAFILQGPVYLSAYEALSIFSPLLPIVQRARISSTPLKSQIFSICS